MSTIMIVGGAGFIGSHLADAYLRGGTDKVITVDNLSTTPDLYNLQFAKNHKNNRHVFYLADICDLNITEKILLLEKPDIVINCTNSVLLTHISIMEIIGDLKYFTINETSAILLSGSIEITPGKIFGGRQIDGLVPGISYRILNGQRVIPPVITEVYDWVYIADFVKAVQMIVEQDGPGPFRVSSGWEATSTQIVDMMRKIAGEDLPQIELDIKENASSENVRALGWAPTKSLEESLDAAMAWYQLNQWAFRAK